MKLDEIAQVMIGVVTKRECVENGKNRHEVFSLKSYEEGQSYEEILTDKDLSVKLARKGDLLFRLLYPNRIICVDDEVEGMLVPSQFCIIRPNEDYMDSIVLNWYLNSDDVVKKLQEMVTGSVIKTMTISNLKNLYVPEISMDEQKRMRELIMLWEQEKRITKEILDKKEKLYECYLEKIIEKNGGN